LRTVGFLDVKDYWFVFTELLPLSQLPHRLKNGRAASDRLIGQSHHPQQTILTPPAAIHPQQLPFIAGRPIA